MNFRRLDLNEASAFPDSDSISQTQRLSIANSNICDKVFENELSEICGRPILNLVKQTISLQMF